MLPAPLTLPWRTLSPRQCRMLGILAVAVALANIDQTYRDVAPLQHIPTVLLILASPYLLRRWPLSDRSAGMIVGFFLLHTLAARWTYSNVPYDSWARALTKHDVSSLFGAHRNGFDRLVHFSFGLLWVPPITEATRRHGGLSPRASLWMAFLFVGAVSAAYEIFEWLLTLTAPADIADDYDGQQGDVWDSQKDMSCAIVGGAVAVLWERVRRATPRDGGVA